MTRIATEHGQRTGLPHTPTTLTPTRSVPRVTWGEGERTPKPREWLSDGSLGSARMEAPSLRDGGRSGKAPSGSGRTPTPTQQERSRSEAREPCPEAWAHATPVPEASAYPSRRRRPQISLSQNPCRHVFIYKYVSMCLSRDACEGGSTLLSGSMIKHIRMNVIKTEQMLQNALEYHIYCK